MGNSQNSSDNEQVEKTTPIEIYEDYNRGIREIYLQNIKALDSQNLYISAGALGLSLTFISDLVDTQNVVLLQMLIASWVLLSAAIVISLLGFRFTTKLQNIKDSLDAARQKLGLSPYEDVGPDPDAADEKQITKECRLDLYNRLSLWSLIVGILAMVTFVSCNAMKYF